MWFFRRKNKKAEKELYTYGQWVEKFDEICKSPDRSDILEELKSKRADIPCDSLNSFLKHLDDSVRCALEYRIKAYIHTLDELFSDGDYDGAEILTIRFQKRIEECFYFKAFDFLPHDRIEEIENGYALQIDDFWHKFLTEVKKEADENNNVRLEDFVYEISRINLTAGKGEV